MMRKGRGDIDLMTGLADEEVDEGFDKELDEMIKKNQQRLAELQSDMKEVNKISGEPVVNVRKIK